MLVCEREGACFCRRMGVRAISYDGIRKAMDPMLVTTKTLAVRAMRADLAFSTMQRMQVIADREGNPFGIAVKAFGAATALAAVRDRCRLPASTGVIGLTPAETALLPEILAWYAELGLSPQC